MEKNNDWYLPDFDSMEAIGPFNYEQIVASIKNGDLRVDDYIWSPTFPDEKWFRIYEIKDFQGILAKYPKCKFPKKRSKGSSAIKKVDIQYSAERSKIALENEYRRYPRAPLKTGAVIHNQDVYCHGIVHDISEKGLYLEVEDLDLFEIGEEVIITILRHEAIGTFSVQSVIINTITKDHSQGYGIYFLRVNPNIRRRIAQYVVKTLSSPMTVGVKSA